jgi:hypothetical protein
MILFFRDMTLHHRVFRFWHFEGICHLYHQGPHPGGVDSSVLIYLVSSNSVPTSQKTNCASIVKTYVLMLYKKIIAVCFESHTEHIFTLY